MSNNPQSLYGLTGSTLDVVDDDDNDDALSFSNGDLLLRMITLLLILL